MNLHEYWSALRKDIDNFKTNNKIVGDAGDEAAYKLQLDTLEKMYTLGMEIEALGKKISNPFNLLEIQSNKRKLQSKSRDLNKSADKFGNDKIPPIAGNKSLQFARMVYAGYLNRFALVTLNEIEKGFAKLLVPEIDFDKQKEAAAIQAGLLNTSIINYKPNPAPIVAEQVVQPAPVNNYQPEQPAVKHQNPIEQPPAAPAAASVQASQNIPDLKELQKQQAKLDGEINELLTQWEARKKAIEENKKWIDGIKYEPLNEKSFLEILAPKKNPITLEAAIDSRKLSKKSKDILLQYEESLTNTETIKPASNAPKNEVVSEKNKGKSKGSKILKGLKRVKQDTIEVFEDFGNSLKIDKKSEVGLTLETPDLRPTHKKTYKTLQMLKELKKVINQEFDQRNAEGKNLNAEVQIKKKALSEIKNRIHIFEINDIAYISIKGALEAQQIPINSPDYKTIHEILENLKGKKYQDVTEIKNQVEIATKMLEIKNAHIQQYKDRGITYIKNVLAAKDGEPTEGKVKKPVPVGTAKHKELSDILKKLANTQYVSVDAVKEDIREAREIVIEHRHCGFLRFFNGTLSSDTMSFGKYKEEFGNEADLMPRPKNTM